MLKKFPIQRKGFKVILKELSKFEEKLTEFHDQFYEGGLKSVV